MNANYPATQSCHCRVISCLLLYIVLPLYSYASIARVFCVALHISLPLIIVVIIITLTPPLHLRSRHNMLEEGGASGYRVVSLTTESKSGLVLHVS